MMNKPKSPILDLEHNVIWAFENATPYAGKVLAKAVNQNQVARDINLIADDTTAPPKGPHLLSGNGATAAQMCISVKHLELLWSFIYAWMVIYERGIQKSLIENTWNGQVDCSDPVLQRAQRLRDWSSSLQNQCTPWPQDLPSPSNYCFEIERIYGEKANSVFQRAVAFLLGHEWAHAVGGHLGFLPASAPDCDAIAAEQDADVTAFLSLVQSTDDEREKLSNALAILFTLLSTIFLGVEVRSPFVQKRHQPLHVRISNAMQMLNFKNESYCYYFPMLASVILEWALPELKSIPRSAAVYETAEDAFSDTLDRIEKWIHQH
jgi:hypothetical protein